MISRQTLVSCLRLPYLQQRRTFFGSISSILGVISNPFQTLKQLDESRQLLDKTRTELQESYERRQIPNLHTFSSVPGFFGRQKEIDALHKVLAGVPTFLVLFGGSSVGKTALLRQVLSEDKYHIVYFDLRIAGFADLTSLFFALTVQFERLFTSIAEEPGFESFKSQSLSFKHARRDIEVKMDKAVANPAAEMVGIGDIARIFELFQSSLLAYWNYEPENEHRTKDQIADNPSEEALASRKLEEEAREEQPKSAPVPAKKKMPVFLIDECHKLPSLVTSSDAVKMFLDAMLVLSKQDRLCHIVQATSDSFYMHYLRSANVGQHCKILTIGDCTKAEARRYWDQLIIENVDTKPEITSLRMALPDFEQVYKVFGGKLAHLQDFIKEFVDADGSLSVLESSHFLQAYTLLRVHLSYSYFATHSSLPADLGEASAPSDSKEQGFSSQQLLDIMSRLCNTDSLNYFSLCDEIGTDAVDGMVRARILELRWTMPIHSDTASQTAAGEREWHRPDVVPMSPVLKNAMKVVLAEKQLE